MMVSFFVLQSIEIATEHTQHQNTVISTRVYLFMAYLCDNIWFNSNPIKSSIQYLHTIKALRNNRFFFVLFGLSRVALVQMLFFLYILHLELGAYHGNNVLEPI